METALSAARQGVRSSNPLVGAVIIDADGTFLAIGHHRGAGTAHAEADVINRLLGTGVKRDLSAATLIVTLEPCSHTGPHGPLHPGHSRRRHWQRGVRRAGPEQDLCRWCRDSPAMKASTSGWG